MFFFNHKIKKDEVNENHNLLKWDLVGLKVDEFTQHTVCIKCDLVYEFAACTEKNSFGHLVTKLCAHVSFPVH